MEKNLVYLNTFVYPTRHGAASLDSWISILHVSFGNLIRSTSRALDSRTGLPEFLDFLFWFDFLVTSINMGTVQPSWIPGFPGVLYEFRL